MRHLTAGIPGDVLIERRRRNTCVACGVESVLANRQNLDELPIICANCRRKLPPEPDAKAEKAKRVEAGTALLDSLLAESTPPVATPLLTDAEHEAHVAEIVSRGDGPDDAPTPPVTVAPLVVPVTADEAAIVAEILRAGGFLSERDVVRGALWFYARHFEIDFPPSLFAFERTREAS